MFSQNPGYRYSQVTVDFHLNLFQNLDHLFLTIALVEDTEYNGNVVIIKASMH